MRDSSTSPWTVHDPIGFLGHVEPMAVPVVVLDEVFGFGIPRGRYRPLVKLLVPFPPNGNAGPDVEWTGITHVPILGFRNAAVGVAATGLSRHSGRGAVGFRLWSVRRGIVDQEAKVAHPQIERLSFPVVVRQAEARGPYCNDRPHGGGVVLPVEVPPDTDPRSRSKAPEEFCALAIAMAPLPHGRGPPGAIRQKAEFVPVKVDPLLVAVVVAEPEAAGLGGPVVLDDRPGIIDPVP